MGKQTQDVTTHINAPPEKVLAFIGDVRNRTRYVSSLKALTDIHGDPAGGVGTTWKWKFAVLGREFEGTGKCIKYEAGKVYSFQTQGGLESSWTYTATPDGKGTKLSVHVEFKAPDNLAGAMPSPQALEALKKAEAELVINNLKTILEH